MSDNSTLALQRGNCPAPFLDNAYFPATGGHVPGRVCAPVGAITCCLPCPATDWIYPQSFNTWYKVAQSLSAVGVSICVFLLLSWTVLPVERTKRHYLAICLVIGIFLETMAFVIPLGAHPVQCHNSITPNDMRTNMSCAFSGAFIVMGGLMTTVWIALRALSMHLQICHDVVPGTRFFYFSSVIGWGVSFLFFVITMAVTGVSYRFGDTCHVNALKSMGGFWAPLLTIAGIAALLQIATFLYCFKVYLSNLWSDENTQSYGSAGLPSYTSSTRARSAKLVYQRVKKVLWLQWRSVTIIIFLLVDIIFFSIIWIKLDTTINNIQAGHTENIVPFITCLVLNPGEEARKECFKLGQAVLVNEATCIAVLMLLSLTGIQTGLMMIRSSMFVGWVELFQNLRHPRQGEFVSMDAKRYSHDPQSIQLGRVPSPRARQVSSNTTDSVAEIYASKDYGSPDAHSTHHLNPPLSPTSERQYRQPRMSFSVPRPATATPPPRGPHWDTADSPYRPSTASSNKYTPSRPSRDDDPPRV